MEMIPQCAYVIRKGEKPDPGRSNILPWSPALALRPDEWEPFADSLPPLPNHLQKSSPKSISKEEINEKVRNSALLNALNFLNPEDYTAQGQPKLEALKRLTGYDYTSAERDAVWKGWKPKS